MKRHTIIPVILVVVAAAIAMLAPAQLASAADRQATATTIRVRGGEFFFRLSAKSARPGRTTFVVRNTGHVVHDFKINGKKTPLLQPGKTAKLVVTFNKTAKLVVTFKKKGRYPCLCTVPGHAAAGMQGVFRVR